MDARQFPVIQQPVGGVVPVSGKVRQFAIVDNHQQVVIGAIALAGVHFIDPVAAGMATKENDFKDAPFLFEISLAPSQRVLKLLAQDFERSGEMAPLGFGEVIEARLHQQTVSPSRGNRARWSVTPCRKVLANSTKQP